MAFNKGNLWSDVLKTNILRVLGNVVAKWHHQLGVGCMISQVRSIMWRNISEQITCTQESRGKVVSYRLAKLLFGKWLKKPFLTQMLQRLIDLMKKGLFCERNFHGQLVSMEGMEHYVFLWPWSTTSQTEELLLHFRQNEFSKLCFKFAQISSFLARKKWNGSMPYSYTEKERTGADRSLNGTSRIDPFITLLKNSDCISNSMNFRRFVLNVHRFPLKYFISGT